MLISAPTPGALAQRCRAVAGQANGPGRLAPLAWRSQTEEFAFGDAARLAVVAADEAELSARLGAAAAALESAPQAPLRSQAGVHYSTASPAGTLALVFPGAGSQYVGMGSDLAVAFDAARSVWDAAAGLRLADVVFPRPAFSDDERARQRARLAAAESAQPAVALASAAALAIVRALALGQTAAAGLGAGELVASFAEGALDLEGLLRDAGTRPFEDAQETQRFRDRVDALYAAGARVFLEVGPGSALTTLLGEHLAGREHVAVSLDSRGQHGVTALWNALARLAVAGVRFDARPLWEPYLPLPEANGKKAAHALTISGANYGKPYPPPGGAAALPAPNPRRAVPERAAAAPSPVAAAPDSLWTDLQDVQRETAETHTAYQRTAAAAHVAFLQSAEASLAALMGSASEAKPPATPSMPPKPAGVPFVAAPTAVVAPPPKPVEPPVEAPRTTARSDVKALLLAVVAEKTGYPSEMLSLEMHVEADLGIDSIKRVEILSSMQERAPGLPVVKAADLAALKTLGQIVTFLDGDASSAHTPAARARELPAVSVAE